MGKTKKLPRWAQILITAIVTIVAIFLVVSVVVTDWRTKGHVDTSSLIIILGAVALFILFTAWRSLRVWALDIIGEDSMEKLMPWRFLVAIVVLSILVSYILLGDAQVAVPSALQFNIIIVSSTLGGLVLAAAKISRVKSGEYRKLLAVAQKLIMATLLFIFFTALYFTVESIGGIDPDSFELTNLANWFRGACFWSAFASILAGGILFSLGIIDLVLALRHMRVSTILKESKRG
jgi:hypothetical protein